MRQDPRKTISELRKKLKEEDNENKLKLLRGFEWGYKTLRTPQAFESVVWESPDFLEKVINAAEYKVGGIQTYLNSVNDSFRNLYKEEGWREKLKELGY